MECLLIGNQETQVIEIGGQVLELTHLNKFYWPQDGVTKRDMLNYYHEVSPFILPYLKDRPQSLNRFPNGITGASFYQKDVSGKAPDWAKTFSYTTAEGKQREYIVGNGEETLIYMASLGCIELNPWLSTIASPDYPEFCLIDLDPDEGNTFAQVVEVALCVKSVLDALQIPGFLKTSGSTGVHIYIPLGGKYTFVQSKALIKMILDQVHLTLPGLTSMERSLSSRKGKLYLDFLQNHASATVACPYSLRPKPGAPVSAPLKWEELHQGLSMYDYNIKTMPARLQEYGDLFSGIFGPGIDLDSVMELGKRKFEN